MAHCYSAGFYSWLKAFSDVLLMPRKGVLNLLKQLVYLSIKGAKTVKAHMVWTQQQQHAKDSHSTSAHILPEKACYT